MTVWVYALTDPSTREHRYVGASENVENRLAHHIYDCRRPGGNIEKNTWLKSLLARKLEPELELLESATTLAEGNRLEGLWIKECRTRGCPIVNLIQPPLGRPSTATARRGRCSVEGCADPNVGRGWCRRHYDNAMRHGGDPHYRPAPKLVRPRPLTPEEKFWAKVDKDPGHRGCWIWCGSTHPVNGFGVVHYGDLPQYAQQAAHVLMVGPLPQGPGILVNHCGNRACCRPDAEHWAPGTRKEAAELREARYPQMREIRREAMFNAVMTPAKATEIRRLRETEHPSYRVLAEQFGVSPSLIGLICTNQAWIAPSAAQQQRAAVVA